MKATNKYSHESFLESLPLYRDEDKIEYISTITKNPVSTLNLNWMSLPDLEANEDILSQHQASAIRALCNRKSWYDADNSNLYFGNAVLCTMAEFEYASIICYCGTRGIAKFKDTPCHKWHWCDRCANKVRRKLYKRYHTLYKPNSYFITLTNINKVTFGIDISQSLLNAWDELHNYARAMKTSVLIGGYITEECSFDSYYPQIIANPHIHIIAHGVPGLTTHQYKNIKVHVEPITSQEHWNKALTYPIKAINLYKTYIKQITEDNAYALNRAFRNTIEIYRNTTLNRHSTSPFGTFDPRTSISKKMV